MSDGQYLLHDILIHPPLFNNPSGDKGRWNSHTWGDIFLPMAHRAEAKQQTSQGLHLKAIFLICFFYFPPRIYMLLVLHQANNIILKDVINPGLELNSNCDSDTWLLNPLGFICKRGLLISDYKVALRIKGIKG